MNKDKIRVGFVTSSLLVKTGFSNNARHLIPYLYKTGKYEIFHLNQGFGDDIQFQRFPWTNEGVMKSHLIDQNKMNNPHEGEYHRLASYGGLSIEDFIIRNKIEVLILQEDGWGFPRKYYGQSKWFSYLKDNVLLHTTIDSLPILPLYKEWAEDCKNMWVWTSFGEKALKQENIEKYGHLKTVFGCLDTKTYSPISLEEKNNLRKKFNIDLDTNIFIHLGRAQLRKLYPQTIESFAKFKKTNPDKKAKILLHCSFMEGWPFEMLIKENGLNKEDVLVSYFCNNCGDWDVRAYEGEFKDCNVCGARGQVPTQQNPHGNGRKTAGVDSLITNKDIAKIYGMCDACISPFTSGGFEFCNAESLLCGLPLLCTSYSAGESFCEQEFVFPLDGTYTYEQGSGFKKHVPNIDTMVKFYETICNMSYEKRQEIGKQGRKWAEKEFSIETIGGIFENWIDTRNKIDWDYKYPPEDIKNVNAQIEDKQDDKEFITYSYKTILNMDRTEKDDDFQHWYKFLQQPQDKKALKESMIATFRQAGFDHNQRVTPPISFDTLLDNSGRKRVGIIIPESIGDIILVLSLLDSLRNRYNKEDWALHFITKPEFFELLDCNNQIDKIVPYTPELDNLLLMEGQGINKGYFDVLYPVHFGCQRLLNYMHNGIDKHDLNLKGDK